MSTGSLFFDTGAICVSGLKCSDPDADSSQVSPGADVVLQRRRTYSMDGRRLAHEYCIAPIFHEIAGGNYSPPPLRSCYRRSQPRRSDYGSLATDVTVSTPSGLLPVNGASLAYPTSPLEFSWTNVAGSASYQFQLAEENSGTVNCSLSGAFSAELIRVDTQVTRPGYVPTMQDTQSANIWTGTYCWRVRGVAPDGSYGLWASGNRVARTWSGTPTGLKFYNDEDGSTPRVQGVDADYATGDTITKVGGYLQWAAVAGASSYDVQIAKAQSFAPTSIMLTADSRKGTRIVLPHLPNSSTGYFWRVRSISPNGTESAWAGNATQQFEVRWFDANWRNLANVTPADGSTAAELTMGWTPMPGASYYEVQAATDSGCFWEDNSPTGNRPQFWGDWVNDPSYTPPTTLAVPEPPTYPSKPRTDECRLTPNKLTTINNFITLDKLLAPEVLANISNNSCWDGDIVTCYDAGLPSAGHYGWQGPYNNYYGGGTVTLDNAINAIYPGAPPGPRIQWRVRPVYQISQATEGGWTVSPNAKEVYGRWLERDVGASSIPLNFMLDPNADAPVSTGNRCSSGRNPTGDGCLVMDANPLDTNRPTRMQAGPSDVDDSTSMQFPLLQWQQFAGIGGAPYAGGYIVQIANDSDFATINMVREIYVPFLGASAYGWQNSVALTDSLPDVAQGTGVGYWWRVVPCDASPTGIPTSTGSSCTPLYYAATAGTSIDFTDGAGAQTFTKETSIVAERSDAFAGQAPLISWHAATAVSPAEKSRGIDGADHYEIQFASRSILPQQHAFLLYDRGSVYSVLAIFKCWCQRRSRGRPVVLPRACSRSRRARRCMERPQQLHETNPSSRRVFARAADW